VVEKFVLQLEAQLPTATSHRTSPEAPNWLADKGYDEQAWAPGRWAA
jgi:hypothetical protein